MDKHRNNTHNNNNTSNTITEEPPQAEQIELKPPTSTKHPQDSFEESCRNTPDPHKENRSPTTNNDPRVDKTERRNESEQSPDQTSSSSAKAAALSSSSSSSTDDKNKREDEEEEEKRVDEAADNPYPGLPVDHGWAWVVMAAQFVITLLIIGYGRALSIFFMEFLVMFEVPVTTATTAFGIMTAFFGIGNMLVSHVLLSRFNTRKVLLTGSLICSTFVALSALAPNMTIITVTHCFIGFSHALMYVPGYTTLGHYFLKRRSFAMAVANTGLSVAALLIPPLTQYLINAYGTRGAILLVAGMELQSVVVSCLSRPVSSYARKKRPTAGEGGAVREPPREGDEQRKPSAKTAGDDEKDASDDDDRGDSTNTTTATTRLLARECEDGERETRIDDTLTQPSSVSPPFTTSPLSASVPEKSLLAHQPKLRYSSEEELRVQQRRIRSAAADRCYVRQQSCPADHHRFLPHRQDSHKSGSSVVNICGSDMNMATDAAFLSSSNDVNEEESKGRGGEGGEGRGGFWGRCATVVSAVVDVSLFKNWLFLLIIGYVPLGFNAQFIAFYFPSLGVEMGLPRSEAALLMTVLGGVDLVSRLALGYLADLQLIKRTHLVAVCLMIMGVACQFCKYYTNFGLLAMFAVVYGLVGGACSNLFAVVIIDLLGLALLGKVMGLVLVFNAIFASLNHILIGAMVDVTGSFAIPYSYLGGCLLLSSVILLMEPLARRLEAKRLQKLDSNVDSAREPMNA
ncbi:uncharacterized protein LOC143286797 [Babylonia areolata]|uniref:uncharacterized protein LOC143286797 n=1 Tax=Babylonia areolata TaxID=304850 RepID=UPI003FD01551